MRLVISSDLFEDRIINSSSYIHVAHLLKLVAKGFVSSLFFFPFGYNDLFFFDLLVCLKLEIKFLNFSC